MTTDAAPSAAKTLSPEQIHALFDILSHHETYAEIERFKHPDAVTSYGYPFAKATQIPKATGGAEGGGAAAGGGSSSGWKSWSTTPVASGSNTPRSRTPVPPDDAGDAGKKKKGKADDEPQEVSTSPVLQTLLTRFVLQLPWLRDLPREFWSVRVQGLLSKLADADLSESYDKGALGLRKTLATGSSAVVEMLGRGALGGVKKKDKKEEKTDGEYNLGKAEDLERAWDDAVQKLVYGDLVGEMFGHMTESDDLEACSPEVKAASRYAIIHLATILHQIFVGSPEGQYLLKMIENMHGLLPYKLIKQTLRVGNAATMISGMLRLLLAKLSVGGITNWFGLTQNADDGMNLLQRIISLVLSWDAGEFRKNAEEIEKGVENDKEEPPNATALRALARHASSASRVEFETARSASIKQSQSIIAAVLSATSSDNDDQDMAEVAFGLSETQHAAALEYYSALLSARDYDEITNVLCKSQPDLFTQMIREVVNAYDPMLRAVHSGVDLREFLEEGQGFIDDFIRAGRPKKVEDENENVDAEPATRPTSVEDYVDLLVRNRGLLFRFMHAVASKCPEVWGEVEMWAKGAAIRFRPKGGASSMDKRLETLFQEVPEAKRQPVLDALDAHAKYLARLEKSSREHLQQVLDTDAVVENTTTSPKGSQSGPGMYLLRWQALLDEALITPSLPVGPVRSGREVKHALPTAKANIAGVDEETTADVPDEKSPEAPDVSVVVKEMAQKFVKILQELGGP